jgi:hypothetical protein
MSGKAAFHPAALRSREIPAVPIRLSLSETLLMSPRVPGPPIPYAAPGVRTAPRRTLPRVLGRWLWNLLRAITRFCQALLLGLGYSVLGAATLLRAALGVVAAVLLFAGRLRWSGPAIRVWMVRSLNRARIKASGLVRRDHNHVPLATPCGGGPVGHTYVNPADDPRRGK